MKKNLIRNPRWCPGPDGGPMFFSSIGTTFDNFCLDGHRTCSITQTPGMTGYDQYDPLIPIQRGGSIQWGYILRAIEAEHIVLQAVFFNSAGRAVDTQTRDIAGQVTAQFQRHMARFTAPRHAVSVQLSLHFKGRVTACTFLSPAACTC